LYLFNAKEKLIIDETPDGKIDTERARGLLSSKTNVYEKKLDDALSSNKKPQFDLEDVRVNAKKNIDKSYEK
jgi:hypothetical protein